jgi:hypothetical protein
MVAQGKFYILQRESSSQLVCALAKQQQRVEATSCVEKEVPQVRSVRFNDNATLHPVLNRKDYTRTEKGAAFWSATELYSIKRNVRALVLQLEKGNSQEKESDVIEFSIVKRFMRKYTFERRRIRTEAVRSILMHQLMKGEMDEFWLSRSYRPSIDSTIRSAYIRAFTNQQNDLAAAPFHQIMVR